MVIGFSNIPSNKSNKIFFQPIINDIPRIIRVNKDSAEGSIQRTTKRTMRNDWWSEVFGENIQSAPATVLYVAVAEDVVVSIDGKVN